MDIQLTSEQRSRLELIAMHAGKQPAQILLEAALFLLEQDPAHSASEDTADSQKFLSEAEMDARLSRILRH